jgi:hypothetical protein
MGFLSGLYAAELRRPGSDQVMPVLTAADVVARAFSHAVNDGLK